jgi:NTP pyrophosphatase (non-canonical NTP hydrolase)
VITDIREYCKLAQITSSTKDADSLTKLQHAVTGFTTETGELADVIKRFVFYTKKKEIDPIHVREELGDMIWYWAEACAAFGFDPAEVLHLNIEKLKARYPAGTFDVERALNRDLDKERQVLEGKSTNAGS